MRKWGEKIRRKKKLLVLSIINIINHYYVISYEVMLLQNHIINYDKNIKLQPWHVGNLKSSIYSWKKLGQAVLPNGFQNNYISIREAATSKKPQPKLF